MLTAVLPNKLVIAAVSKLEAAALYREIFETQTYMKHGIQVADGDCIFDVGANIGLFTVYLAKAYRNLTVFAFEPIPALSALLRKNVSMHAAGATVAICRHGLSNRSGTVPFAYDRFASFSSTMRGVDVEQSVLKDVSLDTWIRASVRDLQQLALLPDWLARMICWGLTIPILKVGIGLLWRCVFTFIDVRKRLFLRRIVCPIQTVSEIMRQRHVEAVDLMKIDVEGSELDVVRGIDEQDWPKIKQFVVEVHDVDGRVETLQALFELHGYRTILDREDWEILRLLGIYTLYAIRP